MMTHMHIFPFISTKRVISSSNQIYKENVSSMLKTIRQFLPTFDLKRLAINMEKATFILVLRFLEKEATLWKSQ